MTMQTQMTFVTQAWMVEGRFCRIIQQPLGYLCGYVRADELRGVETDEEPICDLECHGGVTYSGTLENPDEWWIGFDCAHAWDLIPGCNFGTGGTYKDVDYVTEECEKLVQQLNHPKTAPAFTEQDYRYAKSFFTEKNIITPQNLEEFLELTNQELDESASHGDILADVITTLCYMNVALYPKEVEAILNDLSIESPRLRRIIKTLD